MCSYERLAILCYFSCRPASHHLIWSFYTFCFLSNCPCSLLYPYPHLKVLTHSSLTKNRQIDSHRPYLIPKSIFLPVNKRSFPASLKNNPSPRLWIKGFVFPLLPLWRNISITWNMLTWNPSFESPPFSMTSSELNFSKEISIHTISTYSLPCTLQPILISSQHNITQSNPTTPLEWLLSWSPTISPCCPTNTLSVFILLDLLPAFSSVDNSLLL